MEIKIKSGGLTNPGQSTFDPSKENWGGWALRNIARTPFAVGESLAGLPGSISELALKGAHAIQPYIDIPSPVTDLLPRLPEHTPLPTPETFKKYGRDAIESKLLPKGYLQTQGKGEELLDMVTGDIPFIFGGKAGMFPKLAQLGESIGGNTALKGAQEMGWGVPLQIASAMLGRLTGGSLTRGVMPTLLRTKAEKISTENLNKAEQLAKTKKLASNATEFEKELNSLEERLDSELPTAQTKQIRKHINALGSEIHKGKAKVWNMRQKEKALNNIIYKTNISDLERGYYHPLREATMNFLNKAGEEHPEFGQPYKMGKDLYHGIKYKSTMRDILETHGGMKIFTEKPWLKALLLGGGAAFGHLGKVAKAGGVAIPLTWAAREMARGIDFYNHSAEGKKMIHQIGKEAMLGNKKTVLSLLSRLSGEADSYERQTGQQQANIKVKSGGLK